MSNAALISEAFKRRNKFGAKPIEVDGIRFDSGAEAKRYGELKLLEKAGDITHLECHPSWKLYGVNDTPLKSSSGRQLKFTGDFQYRLKSTGDLVVEDVKGGKATATQAYKIRLAIFKAMFPNVDFREVRR